MKVLLSGDVNGKWNALFKRVSAVNKSNGPFDLLLCTGRTFPDAGKRMPQSPRRKLDVCNLKKLVQADVQSFFPAASGPTEDNADIDAELQPYLDGSKLPPIPSYFIGAYGHGCVTALKALQQAGSAGLTYLGRSGLETLQGLRIAFLDGTHSSLEYTQGPAEHSSPSACRHFTKVGPCGPTSNHPGTFHPAYLPAEKEAAFRLNVMQETHCRRMCKPWSWLLRRLLVMWTSC